MSAEKGGSKADTLVKVVLVFFISLLSFSVGTFVGKQVSDSDHRRMALEGEFKNERNIASTETKDEDKISEKEVESLTEEFVSKEKMAAAETGDEAEETKETKATTKTSEKIAEKSSEKSSGEKAEPAGYKSYNRTTKVAEEKTEIKKTAGKKESAATSVAAVAEGHADATHAVAEKVAKGEAPTDGAKEERKPASTLPSVAASAVGKYTVQVASYAEEKEAKTHAADLKGKGWNAFYFPAAVQGRTWFRVSVGLFNNFKSATDFRAQFMKDANTKSAIVQKIIQ